MHRKRPCGRQYVVSSLDRQVLLIQRRRVTGRQSGSLNNRGSDVTWISANSEVGVRGCSTECGCEFSSRASRFCCRGAALGRVFQGDSQFVSNGVLKAQTLS
ncbi:hypothetical protein AAFF_G00093620 [Aldrovandia affinis]|uniref:Uncharacterized protein n=1 Tax=Aldrovandia affinis TaxID=143900 RepID=A0AAD7WXL2_9TELE|nr:hypothetical protein AAFF_G00093620 [Aldrovandia affinis]